MNDHLDPTIDWLADASLTPEERRVWNLMRGEFVDMHSKMHLLETRINLLEHAPEEESIPLLTRPEFNREVARMLAFDERYGGVSSVLYFDFENLGAVATSYGRPIMDAAIRKISNILMKNIRNSDIVGRLAPDEFGVLLMRCDNASAWKKGELLGRVLHGALAEVEGYKLTLDINYGAYTFEDVKDITLGLKEAAQKMTMAKG